jgi:prepilin-type N-terminal cleavage/methylation domain-containing protein
MKRGFTIVEMLLVIVVIAVLAAITVIAYNGLQTRAKSSVVRADLENMQKVIEAYRTLNGNYPNTNNVWQYRRRDGNAFIPGVVPSIAASLPDFGDPLSGGVNDTYIYMSDGAGYKLYRLCQPMPSAEWALVPADMKPGSYTDRYGVASPGWLN